MNRQLVAVNEALESPVWRCFRECVCGIVAPADLLDLYDLAALV